MRARLFFGILRDILVGNLQAPSWHLLLLAQITSATMGAGSSLAAEAAFHAVDTDKDGKVTLQELGAMLKAQGFAWSPERIEGFLSAFDENGDGALDQSS